MTDPRASYLCWDDTFMYCAQLFALRSKDPHTQVGACIVDQDRKVVGVGYNGLPRGCADSDFPWNRPHKYLYVVHAEKNAITNSDRVNLKGCCLYCTHHPCNECAKDIIQAGICQVKYLVPHKQGSVEHQAAVKMFEAAGVLISQYTPLKQIELGHPKALI